MQAIPILTLREGWLIAAGVVALVLFMWFLARLSHRPYVITGQSEADQVVAMQLGRIAEAVDRLARSLENRTRVEEEHTEASAADEKHHAMSAMNMSMFGR